MLPGWRGRMVAMVAMVVALTLVALPAVEVAADDMSAAAAATSTPGVYEFLGRGFRPQEAISTWLTGPQQQVIATDSTGSDRDGVVYQVFRIPRHYEAGRWAMTAQGHASGRQAVAYFDVVAQGPDIPLLVNPASGSPGTTFAFTGGPLAPGEVGSYWATSPDGQTVAGDYVEANDAGRVDFAWTVPVGGPTGVWTITLYGPQSDRLGEARITIA